MGYHGKRGNPCHLCDAGSLQETRLIDHILEKYWKELHLTEVSAADLLTMLSKSQIEVLPKFKKIFNTH